MLKKIWHAIKHKLGFRAGSYDLVKAELKYKGYGVQGRYRAYKDEEWQPHSSQAKPKTKYRISHRPDKSIITIGSNSQKSGREQHVQRDFEMRTFPKRDSIFSPLPEPLQLKSDLHKPTEKMDEVSHEDTLSIKNPSLLSQSTDTLAADYEVQEIFMNMEAEDSDALTSEPSSPDFSIFEAVEENQLLVEEQELQKDENLDVRASTKLFTIPESEEAEHLESFGNSSLSQEQLNSDTKTSQSIELNAVAEDANTPDARLESVLQALSQEGSARASADVSEVSNVTPSFVRQLLTRIREENSDFNVEFIEDTNSVPSIIKMCQDKGKLDGMFIVNVSDQYDHFCLLKYKNNGPKTSIIMFETAEYDESLNKEMEKKLDILFKDEKVKFIRAELNIAESKSKTLLPCLFLAKDFIKYKKIVDHVHAAHLNNALKRANMYENYGEKSYVCSKKIDIFLPSYVYKHVTDKKRLSDYMKVNYLSNKTTVDKQERTLLQRFNQKASAYKDDASKVYREAALNSNKERRTHSRVALG